METSKATTSDNNNSSSVRGGGVADTLSVQPSTSYSTSQSENGNQSVQSVVTHGTHGTLPLPHSPLRPVITPQSLSPASSQNNNTNQRVVNLDTIGMDVIPQYERKQSEDLLLGMRQDDWHVDVPAHQHQHRELHSTYEQNRQRSNPVSEDDITEPSSSANTRENTTIATAGADYTRSGNNNGATSTFGRLKKNTAKTINNRNISTNTYRKKSEDEIGVIEGALIYGYLQKLNRNGKWQTRWFETDGKCLTYFKSSKRTKLLASLDLAKVGSIAINHDDQKGCGFVINISKRPYHLRADSKTAMKDWVITLNRVKEARMQEGNVKLVMPEDFQNDHQNQPLDLLDVSFTPRVVVVASRQRTHAVEDDEDFHSWETNGLGLDENKSYKDENSLSTAATTRIARWKKTNTSLTQIASKILRWARSIRKYRCSDDAVNQVVSMDHTFLNTAGAVPVTTSKSQKHAPNSMVVTGDFLNKNAQSMVETLPSNKNTVSHQTSLEDDDYEDDDVRFLS